MARGKVLWACVLALVGSPVVGCGSGSQAPPPSCLAVQPCGGDVTGTWSFLGACENLAAANEQLQAGCAGEMLNGASVSLTGLLTFNADLTYTAAGWHETFGASETLPLSCAGTATCAANNSTVKDNASNATETLTTSCSGTSTCSCLISGALSVTTESGTYSIATTSLSMTGQLTGGSFAYCVEESRLHLMQVATTTVLTNPPTTTTTVLSDIVAQRQ